VGKEVCRGTKEGSGGGRRLGWAERRERGRWETRVAGRRDGEGREDPLFEEEVFHPLRALRLVLSRSRAREDTYRFISRLH